MKKFEYKVKIKYYISKFRRITLEAAINEDVAKLNDELSAEGWELASFSIAYGNVVAFTFKREIQ